MKLLTTLVVVAATLSLSPALAEPRDPNTALVPIEQSLASKTVEGRQSAVVEQARPEGITLSAAERSIIDRNVPHR